MKKNVFIRILAALGGVTLWMLGLCALAETFFHVPVTGWIGQLLGARTPVAVLLTLLLAIALCAFGVCCLLMLSGKRTASRKGFVMQKGENGMIGVSVKSIEGLVQTCIRQHEVVHAAQIAVVERRDGIVILLDIQEAAGVNIPLAVGALQKQIKQYVNECTGVDVHEVRVMVENTEDNVIASPYAVKEPVVMTTAVTAAELQREAAAAEAAEEVAAESLAEAPAEQEAPAEDPIEVAAPVEEAPAEPEVIAEEAAAEPAAPAVQPAPMVMPVIPEIMEDEDDRPLHQRLFGTEEQPVFVPAPPELIIEPQTEAEAPAEEAAEIAEESDAEPEETAEEAVTADAVLEVVEAIAEEPFSLVEEIASAQELESVVEEAEEASDIPAEDESDENIEA